MKTKWEAPHYEDRDCNNLEISGKYNYKEFISLLTKTLSPSIANGFGVELEEGQKHIGCDFPPEKSIITIQIEPNEFSIVKNKYKSGGINGIFEDKEGIEFRFLSITDYCFCEYAEKIQNNEVALRELNKFISFQEKLYLRIGLTRSHQSQDGREGFWIQINGIYTYPEIFSGIRNLFIK